MSKDGTAREIRLDRGLTLAEMAAAIGENIAEGTLSRWERGLATPPTARALAWYGVLAEISGSELAESAV